MASLTQWTWAEWTPGVGDGQRGLVCCDSWGGKESDMTELLNWTDLNEYGTGQWLCLTWSGLDPGFYMMPLGLWFVSSKLFLSLPISWQVLSIWQWDRITTGSHSQECFYHRSKFWGDLLLNPLLGLCWCDYYYYFWLSIITTWAANVSFTHTMWNKYKKGCMDFWKFWWKGDKNNSKMCLYPITLFLCVKAHFV